MGPAHEIERHHHRSTAEQRKQALGHANQGVLQQADGERFAEVTLVDRPTIGAIIGTNTGTANDFTEGDYLVQCVASYRDAYGNVHRSTPSDPCRYVSVAAPNTPRVWTIHFSYHSYTNRNDVQLDEPTAWQRVSLIKSWRRCRPRSPRASGGRCST